MQRLSLRRLSLLALVAVWPAASNAEPGFSWKYLDPGTAASASPIDGAVRDYVREHRLTAIMVVQNDRVVATAGDIARRVNVRSVRKSLLSALFGIATERGQIDIDQTLEQLRIDDVPPPLTSEEKQATVRELLMSRSGVYHVAAYETREQRLERPARGSHPHGAFWYYNNWDFNALGAIYAKATGENPFQAFERLIARPIGMEDFTAYDGIFIGDGSSLYRAYVFNMSARDLARFGLLFLHKGEWNGEQIIPSRWITESTKAYSQTHRMDREYGYLWWVLDSKAWGENAILAAGYGGQLIAVLPEKQLVVVELVELTNSSGVRTTDFLDLVRRIAGLAQ